MQIIDHIPGVRFMDYFDDLTYKQKRRTGARDVAQIMYALYAITATHCGSMQLDLSLQSSQRATHHGNLPKPSPIVTCATLSGRCHVAGK